MASSLTDVSVNKVVSGVEKILSCSVNHKKSSFFENVYKVFTAQKYETSLFQKKVREQFR